MLDLQYIRENHGHSALEKVLPFSKTRTHEEINLSSNTFEHPSFDLYFKIFLLTFATKNHFSRYPQFEDELALAAAATIKGLTANQVVFAPGGDPALQTCVGTFSKTKQIIIPDPCYHASLRSARINNINVIRVPWINNTDNFVSHLKKEIRINRPSLVFLETPNSFDGRTLSLANVASLLDSCTKVNSLLILDDAYAAYANIDYSSLLAEDAPLLIIRTYSKSHGAAGLRLAAVFGPSPLIELFRRSRIMNGVSQIALSYVAFAIDYEIEFRKMRAEICQWRNIYTEHVRKLEGWSAITSAANFVVAVAPKGLSLEIIGKALEKQKIRARTFLGYDDRAYIRFTAAEPNVVAPLLEVLSMFGQAR